MTDENKEETKVGLKTYLKYLKYIGGWLTLVILALMNIVWMYADFIRDKAVGDWSMQQNQELDFWSYFWLLWGSILVSCFLIVFQRVYMNTKIYNGGREIHRDMVKAVSNAPINTYFDVTPAGRILNKFISDLNAADRDLGWHISHIFTMAIITI